MTIDELRQYHAASARCYVTGNATDEDVALVERFAPIDKLAVALDHITRLTQERDGLFELARRRGKEADGLRADRLTLQEWGNNLQQQLADARREIERLRAELAARPKFASPERGYPMPHDPDQR